MARMMRAWEFPRKGYIKINVHATYFNQPLPNGNISGIGVVIRNHKDSIIKMISGSIPGITQRANELWAMLAGLCSGFYEDEKKVMLESDNDEAVRKWKGHRWFIDPNHSGVIHQLEQRKADPNGNCMVSVVNEDQNRLARFLAWDGAHNRTRLVVFGRAFGRVKELWRWDMGPGPIESQYHEIEEVDLIVNEVDFKQADVEEAEWLVEGSDSISMGHR